MRDADSNSESKSKAKTGTDPRAWRPATRLVRGGTLRSPHGETAEAMYLTSGFVYASAGAAEARFKNEEPGYIYSRYGNPTVAAFEERMALLEGAEAARATTSGMAAVHAALICQLKAGDRVVAARALFGSCRYIVEEFLPRFGVQTTLVDGRDLEQWRRALKGGARCVFLETPSNPTLEIIDLKAVADLAHAAGARLVVDNVFATPLLQKPMAFGADVVVYSATKHIDGQGRCLGGVILSDRAFAEQLLAPVMRHIGPSLSPFNAWVLLKGLETLDLRVRRHCQNAAAVADFLSRQRGVTRVLHPGREDHPQYALARRQMSEGGSVVTFDLEGGKARAFRFLDALGLVDISNNLGDAKSLITHPATTTHQRLSAEGRAELGIADGTLRLSVGLEDVADIIDDLTRALAA
ncbi:MAG TPA: O-succinylhomoserine sulfhydrylase [Candidatus Sulfotelmatobacter sp.]|nr:O-succinylhomoserine sulfhydrylase [Candidatus Sulfotelmatobacter sp.]